MRCAILAGGLATRMGGRPKPLLEVGGVRIVDRLVREATAAFGVAPLLVAGDPAWTRWCPDLSVVADRRSGGGSLGGLWTAVHEAPAPVVVIAGDMPFVTAALIRRLAAGLAGCDAFLPQSDGPRGLEPFCAAYAPQVAAPIEAALDQGDLRAIAFHHAITLGVLPLGELERFGDPARLLFNVNTPEDLVEANRLAGSAR